VLRRAGLFNPEWQRFAHCWRWPAGLDIAGLLAGVARVVCRRQL
jgi:hypothetical protein